MTIVLRVQQSPDRDCPDTHTPVQAACFEEMLPAFRLARPNREQAMARRYSVTASLGIVANSSIARSL